MGRSPCCEKDGLKKGPWTPEEDKKLIDYIKNHGYGNWRTLPKNAGLQRCGKSCRLRWTNYLRPDIKRGRFSSDEEDTIIQLHSILGNKWSAIAGRLPGRTDNEIKNYWNTHIRKRLLRMGIDPVTHSPRLDLLDLSSILRSSLYNSSSSPMDITGLIGVQQFINPELLKLATSLHKNSTLISQNVEQNQFFNPQMHHQDIPSSVQFPNEDQFIMEPFPSNFIDFSSHSCEMNDHWQQSYDIPSSLFQGYVPNGSFHYGSETSTFKPNDDNQNVGFASVYSTPPSSPTPVNSTSTYIANSTEDEREISYCSEIFNFQIPDLYGCLINS